MSVHFALSTICTDNMVKEIKELTKALLNKERKIIRIVYESGYKYPIQKIVEDITTENKRNLLTLVVEELESAFSIINKLETTCKNDTIVVTNIDYYTPKMVKENLAELAEALYTSPLSKKMTLVVLIQKGVDHYFPEDLD